MLAVVGSMNARKWSLFDLGTGKPISTPQLPAANPDSVYFLPLTWSPDGAFIAGVRAETQRSAGEEGRRASCLHLFRPRSNFLPGECVRGCPLDEHSRRLLVYDNTSLTIVDTQTGRRKVLLSGGDRQAVSRFGESR